MVWDFAVSGHGWMRKVFYSEKGVHESFSMPAGGLLVAAMLEKFGANVAPAAVFPPEKTEFLALKRDANGAFSAGDHAGFSPGNDSILPKEAALTIVWDEGAGTVEAPESGVVLWTSRRRIPDAKCFAAVRNRSFLLLSADALRGAGALISRQVSWERSATDLVWQLAHNPKLGFLRDAPEIVIIFDEDGVVHIRRDNGKTRAELSLLHGGFEGEAREHCGRDIPDTWAVMTAQAALLWKSRLDKPAGEQETLCAADIVRPAARLLRNGYDLEFFKEAAYGALLKRGQDEGRAFVCPIPEASAADPDPDYWCICASLRERGMYDLACRYVLEGPSIITGIPRFSCGALTTVDRKEIESFQNIRNLILDYARAGTARPLSIAVFGAPGSGKSFGVTQIAKNALPGVVKLEFNVSQMTSPADLAAAFHAVRDTALSGALPLVFFDEFDSDRDGRPLGWLKNFLMPMQDGKFTDESGEHPVGKCVMVFAGGTAATFDEFRNPLSSADLAITEAFRNVKGPDFISRLRGVINILGPNPTANGEYNFILRRALLLRSLLERKLKGGKGRMPVNENVLGAMLLIPRFKHGARSMEAILDMSSLEGASWEPACLPFHTQLSLHVDADAFLRLVLKDSILSAAIEGIARAIHGEYLAKEEPLRAENREGETGGGENALPYVVSWEDLPEEIKNTNREQARHIAGKLESVGCGFDAGDTPYPALEEFTPEETLRLAMAEHERWMADKLHNGWQYGPKRDNAKKIHPAMKEWDELPQAERQKDIDMVRNMIPLLKQAGIRVYRLV